MGHEDETSEIVLEIAQVDFHFLSCQWWIMEPKNRCLAWWRWWQQNRWFQTHWREREREVCVSQWASNLFQKVLLLDWWLCIWRSSPINHFDFSICVWHFKWCIFKPMVEHCDFLTFHFFAHDLSMSRWTASSAGGEKIHSRWQPKTFVLAFASIFGSKGRMTGNTQRKSMVYLLVA